MLKIMHMAFISAKTKPSNMESNLHLLLSSWDEEKKKSIKLFHLPTMSHLGWDLTSAQRPVSDVVPN